MFNRNFLGQTNPRFVSIEPVENSWKKEDCKPVV